MALWLGRKEIRDQEELIQFLSLKGIEYEKGNPSIYVKGNIRYISSEDGIILTFEQNNKKIIYEKIGDSKRLIIDAENPWRIEIYLGKNVEVFYYHPYLIFVFNK